MSSPSSLSGRVALVTGVSRPEGIGLAVAELLHASGAIVVATGWPPHDAEMSLGATALAELAFDVGRHDLEDPAVPHALIDEVAERHGAIDIVVAAHARSSHDNLDAVTAAELDRCWAVNVRSVVLLAQRFADRHRPAPIERPPRGRMIWFTSGQHIAPMHGELAYAISKGALHQMTTSVARALTPSRITVNCLNPGPIDTGYAPPPVHAAVARRFPDRRWSAPDEIAELVGFLVSDHGAVIRGQVIDAESGFDRLA